MFARLQYEFWRTNKVPGNPGQLRNPVTNGRSDASERHTKTARGGAQRNPGSTIRPFVRPESGASSPCNAAFVHASTVDSPCMRSSCALSVRPFIGSPTRGCAVLHPGLSPFVPLGRCGGNTKKVPGILAQPGHALHRGNLDAVMADALRYPPSKQTRAKDSKLHALFHIRYARRATTMTTATIHRSHRGRIEPKSSKNPLTSPTIISSQTRPVSRGWSPLRSATRQFTSQAAIKVTTAIRITIRRDDTGCSAQFETSRKRERLSRAGRSRKIGLFTGLEAVAIARLYCPRDQGPKRTFRTRTHPLSRARCSPLPSVFSPNHEGLRLGSSP